MTKLGVLLAGQLLFVWYEWWIALIRLGHPGLTLKSHWLVPIIWWCLESGQIIMEGISGTEGGCWDVATLPHNVARLLAIGQDGLLEKESLITLRNMTGIWQASKQEENVGISGKALLELGDLPSATECTNSNIAGFSLVNFSNNIGFHSVFFACTLFDQKFDNEI